MTGTAAGSTSSTSAAASTATTAAEYEAKAAAVGKQITTLQTKVNSLHQQATQLRQQAAGIKSGSSTSKSMTGRSVPDTLIDQAEAHISFPIMKTETTPAGDLLVYGKATDGTVDSDQQIVDPAWSAAALKDWLSSGANLRVQHNPHRDPAGVGLQVDVDRDGDGSHWLKALIVEPTAQKLVSKGALRAFSVGIMRPKIVTDNKALGGRIIGGELGEVSLVDRPANRNCSFTLVKADKKGRAAWIGALNSDPDFLAKALIPKPSDLARMLGKSAVEAPPQRPEVTRGEIPNVWADPVANRLQQALTVSKRNLPGGRNVDSGGQDRSDMPTKDFAGPNGTFPIESQGDVSDAASLAHHAKDPSAVRSRIRSIARRKWPDMKLPPSLEGKDAEVELEKAGAKACPNCGKSYHADSSMKNCENCGHKLPMASKGDGAECSTCHGTGKILEGHRKCPDCNGSGHMMGKGGGLANFDGKKAPPFGKDGKPMDDDDDDDGEKVAKGHDQDMGDRMQEDDENSGTDDDDGKGSDDTADDDDDTRGQDTSSANGTGEEDNVKTATVMQKMFCPNCGSKVKSKHSFCPGCGSKIAMPDKTKHVIPHSHPSPKAKDKDTKPVPAHREPDGDQMEDFEADSGMQDGDEHGGKPPEPAPTWSKKERGSTDPAAGVDHKAGTQEGPDPDDEEQRDNDEDYLVSSRAAKMRDTDAPYSLMRAHDATCAAYSGHLVLEEYPSLKGFADAIDAETWRQAASDILSGGNMADAQAALATASAASTLKTMDADAVMDARAALHKSFTDMYPDVHLSPGQITASQFNRPYISAGHAPLSAVSPGSQPAGHTPPPPPSADQFDRGPLTAGHQSPSPGDGGNRPFPTGMMSPTHMSVSAPKSMALQAMATIHDTITGMHPELCPMGTQVAAATKNPAGHSPIADQIRRHQQRQTSQAGPQQITKSAEPVVPVIRKNKKKKNKAAKAGLISSIVSEAVTKALAAQQNTYTEHATMLNKQIGDLRAEVDYLGSMPDPNAAALRSATSYAPDSEYASSGAVPVDRRSLVDEAATKVRAEKLHFLKGLANSGDPTIREGAHKQIEKLLMAP